MSEIVVFGSINVDLVVSCKRAPEAGETVHGYDFFEAFGGKGANQAIAAAKLGGEVSFIGAVGDDGYGVKATENLIQNGVKTQGIKTVSNLSTGVATITRTGFENRIIVCSGANGVLTADDVITHLPKGEGYFVAQLETPYEATIAAMAHAKALGYKVIFNPAPARVLKDTDFEAIDLLVVNQTECELISGVYPEDLTSAVLAYDKLSKFGLKEVIVTLGAKGSVYVSDEACHRVEGIEVEAVDTTGAGDAYIGAYTYALSKGLTPLKALQLATKVSALSVTKAGASPSMPTLQDVEAFYNGL